MHLCITLSLTQDPLPYPTPPHPALVTGRSYDLNRVTTTGPPYRGVYSGLHQVCVSLGGVSRIATKDVCDLQCRLRLGYRIRLLGWGLAGNRLHCVGEIDLGETCLDGNLLVQVSVVYYVWVQGA